MFFPTTTLYSHQIYWGGGSHTSQFSNSLDISWAPTIQFYCDANSQS